MTTTERRNADTASPGARYWHRSLHEYAAMTAEAPGGREGGPAEPARFARFGALARHPLPPPARELSPSPACAPDDAFHSALLHYSCGVLRTEFGPTARWPYHRATPSARCFAPVEAYLWTPGHEGLPAGVHGYDPAHHSLVLMRPGDHRPLLSGALGADLDGAVGALLLSTVFWRTAFRYGDYAYRLCAQETGLVAGSVMMVADALGAQAHLHHQFLDGTLERLVGATHPQESVAAVLPLYPRRARARRPVLRGAVAYTEEALSPLLGPMTGRPAAPSTGIGALGELTEIDAAARRSDTASFSMLPTGPAPASRPAKAGAAAGAPGAGTAGLGHWLRQRTSGSPAFTPLPRPVPLDGILRVLGPLLAPWPSDAVPDGHAPPVAAHLWAVNVAGLADGVHRMAADGLRRLGSSGPLRPEGMGTEAANINYRTVAAVVFLSAPRADAQAVFGDRAFRVLHHEAGVVAQRLSVRGAAEGLAARIHNGYAARTLSRALELSPGHEPLFQIALGVPGPDERYLMPVTCLGPPVGRPGQPARPTDDVPARNEVQTA